MTAITTHYAVINPIQPITQEPPKITTRHQIIRTRAQTNRLTSSRRNRSHHKTNLPTHTHTTAHSPNQIDRTITASHSQAHFARQHAANTATHNHATTTQSPAHMDTVTLSYQHTRRPLIHLPSTQNPPFRPIHRSTRGRTLSARTSATCPPIVQPTRRSPPLATPTAFHRHNQSPRFTAPIHAAA